MVSKHYDRDRKRARRLKYINLLGGKCVSCGSDKDLHFDHINPGEKSFYFSGNMTKPESELIKEVNKCQLLCGKCHREKTHDNWEYAQPQSSHGSLRRYRAYGCRCDECKQAASDYYHKNKAAKIKDSIIKIAYITQEGSKYRVNSKKGKNLGTYDTKEEAVKRLRQVEYFKHLKKRKKAYLILMQILKNS